MTFEELFRMIQATLLVGAFSGMCRIVFNRWRHMTPVGRRQYVAFMYLTFWLVIGTLWRLRVGTDLEWSNVGVFSAVLAVTFTVWWRAYEEGPELHERLARPRLDVDDPIRHDNPEATWLSDDEPPHREPRLNPEDYDAAVSKQVEHND